MKQVDHERYDFDDVLNEYDAARMLGVCSKTLRRLRQAALIPHAKVGERIVYQRSRLYEWLAAGGSASQEEVP